MLVLSQSYRRALNSDIVCHLFVKPYLLFAHLINLPVEAGQRTKSSTSKQISMSYILKKKHRRFSVTNH